jgi:hypothetical protein
MTVMSNGHILRHTHTHTLSLSLIPDPFLSWNAGYFTQKNGGVTMMIRKT